MSPLRSRLATAVGLLAFIGGCVLLALAIPGRRGIGYELVVGADSAIPAWAFLLSFIGGPLLIIAGSVVGMRYGHFERYHKDYDPETGTIASNHPFARLHERVSKPRSDATAGTHPPKFVLTRTHLAALIIPLTWGPLVYVLVSLPMLSPLIRWMMVVILGGGGIATFVAIDRLLREHDDMDYEPSW